MKKGAGRIIGKRKVWIALAIFVLGFVLLVGRLVVLQIKDYGYYSKASAQEQISQIKLPALRGTIYDRNMTTLAQSAAVWDVAVSPYYIDDKDKKKRQKVLNNIADNLSQILNIDRTKLYNQINNNSKYIVVAKKIEKETADKIKAYMKKSDIGCIGLVDDSKRYYPYDSLAAQVIGFTGADGQGLTGIEATYNDELSGVPGRKITAQTATGTQMPYDIGSEVAPQDGNNIVLTIDDVVQQDLEKILKKAITDNHVAKGATGIVMDVNTGEILGMATENGFDPNDPFKITDPDVQKQLSTLSGKDLQTATNDALQAQWQNKAITWPYEPGSTFKIITAASALEEGVVHENDQFYDPGYKQVADKIIKCWEPGGHGHQTFIQGFENSCNVVFIEVGQRLGAANFFNYFSNFGLAAKTSIDLPGEAGSIYYRKDQLGPVELASSSFGQSNKITAIQLITAVSASANGGYLVQPHLVKEIVNPKGVVVKSFGKTVKRQVISAETSKEIDKMLQAEVDVGTGHNAYVPGYRVGGKTGTAEKLDSKDPNALVASFVGVAPCDAPQIAVLVVLDEPHASNNFGGVIASPLAGNLLSEILPYLGITPKYSDAELKNLDIKTPNLSGKSVADAKNALKKMGLSVNLIGSGQTVTGQIPAAGNAIPNSGIVTLYTAGAQIEKNIEVPSLQGLKPSEVYTALIKVGLNPDLAGTSKNDTGVLAYEQSAAPGTKVAPGTVITVKFRNENVKVQ